MAQNTGGASQNDRLRSKWADIYIYGDEATRRERRIPVICPLNPMGNGGGDEQVKTLIDDIRRIPRRWVF